MTLTDIEREIQRIVRRAKRGDDEEANHVEDKLRRDILQSIADGTCEHPRQAAALAMTTLQVRFQRWYE